MGTLITVDLIVKILGGMLTLVLVAFAAGKTWGIVSKLTGSVDALHRRMTEQEEKREKRDRAVDEHLTNIRLDIRSLQTWKQTLRFKLPEVKESHDA